MGPLEIKGIILGIAALGGVASLWIGYRLYFHGVIEKGKMNLSAPGSVRIEFSDYGPGVAFWALGVFLLIMVVTRDFSTTTQTTRKFQPNKAQTPVSAPAQPGIVYEETTLSAAAAELPVRDTEAHAEAISTTSK